MRMSTAQKTGQLNGLRIELARSGLEAGKSPRPSLLNVVHAWKSVVLCFASNRFWYDASHETRRAASAPFVRKPWFDELSVDPSSIAFFGGMVLPRQAKQSAIQYHGWQQAGLERDCGVIWRGTPSTGHWYRHPSQPCPVPPVSQFASGPKAHQIIIHALTQIPSPRTFPADPSTNTNPQTVGRKVIGTNRHLYLYSYISFKKE